LVQLNPLQEPGRRKRSAAKEYLLYSPRRIGVQGPRVQAGHTGKIGREILMDEIVTEIDDIEYTTYRQKNFKMRLSDKGLDKLLTKKGLTERDLEAFVHTKMRARGAVAEGAFDVEAKKFMQHIFKEKLKELLKQTKLK
jgi:hypothetical protein